MAEYLSRLRQFISDGYNLDELKTLSFDLGLEYENLPGENSRQGKSRELVSWLARRGQLDLLLTQLQKERPKLFEEAGLSIEVGDVLFRAYEEEAGGLREYIMVEAFKTLVTNRTQDFVGRDFIFQAIERHVADLDFPSGYIIIQGEPGIGKTSVAAHLVRNKGYVHHFNIASDNIRSAHDFLANICAQLIVQFELPYTRLPDDATRHSGFLSRLLGEAAGKTGDRPLIILVDALDEADLPLEPGRNRLDLPRFLPANVFFIVTTRPQTHLFVDRVETIYLRDDDPQNLKDIRQYIQNYLTVYHKEMVDRLAEWKTTADDFVSTLIEKSQGNFMYLVHVLRDIRKSRLTAATIDSISKLPQGLKDYYDLHWRTMKGADEVAFETYYEPVVSYLAAAREPVSLGKVAAWVKISPSRLKKVIREWLEFLNVEETTQGTFYRIYHASFRDFLDHEVNMVEYHDGIVETALNKIG